MKTAPAAARRILSPAAAARLTSSHPRYFVLDDLRSAVICRLDDGESMEEAVEAVIGSGGPAFNELLAFCR